MRDFIGFLVEENSFTVFLFWLSLAVDIYAIYLFNKCIKDSGLLAVLIINVVVLALINAAYLLSGALFNISPIASVILVWVLYKILKEIYDE